MSLFRPSVQRISGYTPGEQPQESGWVKLNTNENPYPPSPRVVEAIHRAADGRLNIYPDPLATSFRRKAAALFGCEPDWILPANGSDENLTILLRSFADSGDLVSFPYPSYILYETLADLQGAPWQRMQLNSDWSWNFETAAPVVARSKLAIVPNPNSPSGNSWSRDQIEQLVPEAGILVLDEAYGDFSAQPHRGEILNGAKGERIVITRSLSKSYSLAGIRFGFAVAHPELIEGMCKVKDSYNCDTIALAAAEAALDDQEWMLKNVSRIRATRSRLTDALRTIGFDVVESDANFLWTTHAQRQHETLYQQLKQRRILVRYMKFDGNPSEADETIDGLRITIGTDEEVDRLLSALHEILERE